MKRAKPVTMTARSKRFLEDRGYICALVERTYTLKDREGKPFVQKFDAFGFADLVCVSPSVRGTLYVQTTSAANQAARRLKIDAIGIVRTILWSGNRVEVHGWAKRGGRGQRKTWLPHVFELVIDGENLAWVTRSIEGDLF